MNDFIKNIKYFILSLKEKSLLRKLKDSTRQSYTNNDTKNVMIKGASLTINSKTLQTIAQVKKNVTSIIQKTNGEPDALIDYIKAAKTPVYKIKNADKILNFINEEEGLITEKEGFDALILSVSTGQGIKFKTAPMFVMREGIIEKYYMLHHFYCWYSLKSGLPGFDYKSRKMFKQYLVNGSDDFTAKLSMAQILSLQEAIARDQEATAYVLEYTKQIEGSQNVMDKIKNEGSANI